MICPACDNEMTEVMIGDIDTDEARHEAARQYYSDMFDGELAEMAKADQATHARAHRIAHALRFICPSYYIPGKQAWGAF